MNSLGCSVSREESLGNLDYAVYIKDLCVSYNGEPDIVKNLSMNVKRRTIYGFLGSSGCGKTTVLSCLVGLKIWKSGNVLLFGNKVEPKNSQVSSKKIGYMPQDTALYNELSITEMMQFYGRIYNLPNAELSKQRRILIGLLELPSRGNKLIKNLSGGEKRRASLALALIHSPELLVLDEPTVGLDPVLREKIWCYLSQLVDNQGTTIIVTTHYIEEARHTDKIGLMRNGRLLIEESPLKLLENYNYSRLEQVVLQICKLDQNQNSGDSVDQTNKQTFNEQNDVGNNLESLSSWKPLGRKDDELILDNYREMAEQYSHKNNYESRASNLLTFFRTTLAFAKVSFLIFFRFPLFFLLVLFIPAIQGTVTLWIIGSKPLGLPLGVVNLETPDCLLNQHQHFNETSRCYFSSEKTKAISLSCKYLTFLKQDPLFNLQSFKSEQQAKEHVDLGKSWGYVTFPTNFSQSFGDLMMTRQYAINETLEGSRVPIVLDYSQYIQSSFIIKSMLLSYTKFLQEIGRDCNFDEKSVDLPFKFREPIYGDNEYNYTSFVIPGVLIFAMFVVGGTITSIVLVDDRKLGNTSRATVAGLAWGNTVTGHIIVQGILSIVQLAIWNLVMYYFFAVPTLGPIWLYILLSLLIALCGNTCGIFFGIFLNDEVDVLIVGLFITNVCLSFGGVVWPSEAMSRFWQNFGRILPTHLPTHAMRSVILRGVGIEHVLVWPGIVAAVVWIFGFLSLSRVVYKKRIYV